MADSLVRKAPARARFGVGRTKFDEDIAPRLDRVQIGPRTVAFTESSINRVIGEMIAESANVPVAPIAPNERRHKAKPKQARR